MKAAKPTNGETQARIVEAALACVKRWGIEKVTLNDIAREAGVTRPTVYSYFSNRDEVIQFALLQSAYTFAQKLLRHIEKYDQPEHRVLEATMYALKQLPKEPALELMSDSGLAQIMSEHALTQKESQDIRRGIFRLIFNGIDVSDDELDELTEVASRFVLSLLTMRSAKKRNDKELRAFLCRRLLPALGLDSEKGLTVKPV